ncbi:MAG TPA: ATP phosphoribosyltransferase [Thermopetrobacter sp.]|nr:ATP phosphoribosyltransferase [Thermopetrobacter sp.]
MNDAPAGRTRAPLTIALPSKGRLMEKAAELFATAGFPLRRQGDARGYRGAVDGEGVEGVEIAFLSASEIAHHLAAGKVQAGVTGEDLLRETIPEHAAEVEILLRLGFGHADVVVAVPEAWLDCATMADLEEIAEDFHAAHGRRLRVATKYLRLTRQFFAGHGIAGYRTVTSLGATEGAPAAGVAELIVDITSTGSTLRANRLKVLDDGVILRSQAVLAARREWLDDPRLRAIAAGLARVCRARGGA